MQRLFITVLACLITTSSIGQSSNNSNLTSDDYFNRGLGHLDIGNNEDAIADFTNAIRIEPDYTEAYYKRGNGYLYLENYEDAIADYTRAIRIDPDYAIAYANRGFTKTKIAQTTTDYDDALDDYNKAIQLIDPESAKLYEMRAGYWLKLNDITTPGLKEMNLDKAIGDYTRAIRIDPDYTEAYFRRGNVYLDLQDWESAIADFTRTVRIDPDYGQAYANRGYANSIFGNWDDAIADCTRAIRIYPDWLWPYRLRGLAKQELGLSACSDFKRGCELGSEDCCEWYYNQCK